MRRSGYSVAFSFDSPPQRLLSSVHRASRPAARRFRPPVRLGGAGGRFRARSGEPGLAAELGVALLARVPSVAEKVEGAFRAGRRFPETGVNLARAEGMSNYF